LCTVRERFWIWGHPPGSHNGRYGLPGVSRMTPAEAACCLGVPNLLMVSYGGCPEPPFDRHAHALGNLKSVVWSSIGDASSTRNDEHSDLDEVVSLAEKFPNITGAVMDDFFVGEEPYGRYCQRELRRFRDRLHDAPRPLDLWVVLYRHQLGLRIADYLNLCDVVTFWTWEAADLHDLEKNFDEFRSLAPEKRKVLGCYLWDYGGKKPIPLDLMQRQCQLGLEWLKQGEIEGMIFLASCICDLGLEAVEWTRDWIARVGKHSLPSI